MKTSAIIEIVLAGDQALFVHTLHDTGGVALVAEQPAAQVDVVDAGVLRNMQEDIETGDIETIPRQIGLLMVINMKENCLQ